MPHPVHFDHMEFVCTVWISEQTANFALQNIKGFFVLSEVSSVYCTVQTESLYTGTFGLLQVKQIILSYVLRSYNIYPDNFTFLIHSYVFQLPSSLHTGRP
jgi:hypothetical protein